MFSAIRFLRTFSLHETLLPLAAGALVIAALTPSLALARDRVDCMSKGRQYNECSTPFREPVLVNQLSMTECVAGRNWGLSDNDGTVWVDQGCSATFAEGRRHDRDRDDRDSRGSREGGIECRSRGYEFARCGVRWRSARLVRRLSGAECEEGRGWGVDRDGLWVDNGCAGYFVEERGRGGSDRGNDTIVCESRGGDTARCPLPRHTRDARIEEQLSSAQCRRGDSWDFDGRGIWVANGCRARFRYW